MRLELPRQRTVRSWPVRRHREEAGEGQESCRVKLCISRASHMHMEYLSRLTTCQVKASQIMEIIHKVFLNVVIKLPSTPVFLPRESHRQRSLASFSPEGFKESDTTEAIWHACKHCLISKHLGAFSLFTMLGN